MSREKQGVFSTLSIKQISYLIPEFLQQTSNQVYSACNSNDPDPEGPALVHPAGVIWVIPFTSSVQVSASEVGPLCRSRSWYGRACTGVGLQLQPHQCCILEKGSCISN
jgi:hypothetical protein